MQPLSKNDEGKYEYSNPSAVFLSEVLKFALSAAGLAGQAILRWRAGPPPPPLSGEPEPAPLQPMLPASSQEWARTVASYAIPTSLYFVNNNLAFTILEGISPATNMALGQSKVFFAALVDHDGGELSNPADTLCCTRRSLTGPHQSASPVSLTSPRSTPLVWTADVATAQAALQQADAARAGGAGDWAGGQGL